MIFTHEITLDIIYDEIKIINIKQYTKDSFLLHVALTDRGEPFCADKDKLCCLFKMITPDKKKILKNGVINDDGSVDISIPESACLAAGSGTAEIVFIESEIAAQGSSTDNSASKRSDEPAKESLEESAKNSICSYGDCPEKGTVFATMNLCINIVASSYNNNGITSSDDFDALHSALLAANKTYDKVMESAQGSANAARQSELNAKASESNAKASELNAEKSALLSQSYAVGNSGLEERPNEKEDCAKHYCEQADVHAKDALEYSNSASQSQKNAAYSALLSQSYAVGGTGIERLDESKTEETDNAKFYYEQALRLADGFSGMLRPMGTVSFANLPPLENAAAGDMYNISDQFTTNANFKEGSGLTVPAGSNVYKTADNKWDILAGSPVTGVKGNAESSYRKGNVNLTPANIGLGNVDNTADKDKSVKYATSAGSATNATNATKATQDGDGNVIKNSYAVRKVISSGSFDSLTTPGLYAVVGSSIANKPDSSGGSYGLIVIPTYSSYMHTQLAFGFKNNNIYIRTGDTSGGYSSWTTWKQLYVEENTKTKSDIVDLIYPVGSIYMSVNSTSPATLFGGTWVRWGNGKVPVGVDTSNTSFSTVEKTGGSATASYTPSGTVGSHILTTSEIPSHKHSVSVTKSGAHKHEIYTMSKGKNDGTAMRIGTTANNDNTISAIPSGGEHTHTVSESSVGGSAGHNHTFTGTAASISTLQPYITCYMWKRTA